MLRLIAIVVVAAGVSYGGLDIDGVHVGGYQLGRFGSGWFYTDATSLIKFVGTATVYYSSTWQVVSGSDEFIEAGSSHHVAYPCNGGGAGTGQHYGNAVYINSSVRLLGNSQIKSCIYTSTDVKFSTTQLDGGSSFVLNDWSTASVYQSNMQLKGSTIQTGGLNQLNLLGAALILTSSSVTTGQGCQLLMGPKSTLIANNLAVNMADYSAFEMAAGSYLITMGSPSSIGLGNRAQLQINGNCVFSGNLNVPDRVLRVVNSTTGDAGFICFPTKVALQLFASKSVYPMLVNHADK